MIAFFNSASLWIGRDLNRAEEIRRILDTNGITHKYKVKNHLGGWSILGTTRSRTGSFGNSVEQMYEYEIFVSRKDLEQAQYLIRK